MKKEDVLKTYVVNPILHAALLNIHRRKIYTLTGGTHTSRMTNIPFLVTHFHRSGIRCKVLAARPMEHGYEDLGVFRALEFTVPYVWILEGTTFTPQDDTDMLKYINCGTKHLREPLQGVVVREHNPKHRNQLGRYRRRWL